MQDMLGRILQALKRPGLVRPMVYEDPETHEVVFVVKTSPRYTTIVTAGREYYFTRESGTFDGVGAMSLDDPLPLNGLLAEQIRRSKPARVPNGPAG
jgi:hypothetical protein